MKTCSKCGFEKKDIDFYKGKNQCITCVSDIRKAHYIVNKDIILIQQSAYKADHQVEISFYQKNWRNANKKEMALYQKEYRAENKDYFNAYAKNRYKTNPIVKLNEIISSTIRKVVKLSNRKDSKLKYLPYTVEKLKQHLEKQFEPWMNWDNHGNYNSILWNDNDPNTWTWQIDHIIPRSTLPYTSMEDKNFQKCWALDNLRPLSAKQNITDGNRRIIK